MERMLGVVSKYMIGSLLAIAPFEEAKAVPSRVAAHDFVGRLVVLGVASWAMCYYARI